MFATDILSRKVKHREISGVEIHNLFWNIVCNLKVGISVCKYIKMSVGNINPSVDVKEQWILIGSYQLID